MQERSGEKGWKCIKKPTPDRGRSDPEWEKEMHENQLILTTLSPWRNLTPEARQISSWWKSGPPDESSGDPENSILSQNGT